MEASPKDTFTKALDDAKAPVSQLFFLHKSIDREKNILVLAEAKRKAVELINIQLEIANRFGQRSRGSSIQDCNRMGSNAAKQYLSVT